MADNVEQFKRLAKLQGWKIVQSNRGHWKWYDPKGKMAVVTANTPSDWRSEQNLKRDLRKAGFDFNYKGKEKSVVSVQDLIKANGEQAPVLKPAPEPPIPAVGRSRMSRAGLDRDILVAIKAVYPREIAFTDVKMKVAMNHPGIAQPTMHVASSKLKAAGKVINTRMGYYRAASAEVEVDSPSVTPVAAAPTPHVIQAIVPEDARKVIDDLVNAVSAAEKLIVHLTRQLREQNEAAEAIKKMAARL
jgi:hypothetical protein